MGIVQFPQKTVAMLTTLSDNPIIILLLIILFLLVLTCFVEVLAAMILVAPVLVQVCSTYSFHPDLLWGDRGDRAADWAGDAAGRGSPVCDIGDRGMQIQRGSAAISGRSSSFWPRSYCSVCFSRLW